MRCRPIGPIALVVAAMAIVGAGAAPRPAEPEACPIEDFTEDAREKLLQDAPSCDRALDLFRACSLGASGDVALGAVVVEKCEAGFLNRLTREQRRTYDREQKRCQNKYRREAGTMYRSFEAFCGAELARNYARRYATPRAR
jgi:hypothetical protein